MSDPLLLYQQIVTDEKQGNLIMESYHINSIKATQKKDAFPIFLFDEMAVKFQYVIKNTVIFLRLQTNYTIYD